MPRRGADAARTAGLYPGDGGVSPGTPVWRPALLSAKGKAPRIEVMRTVEWGAVA